MSKIYNETKSHELKCQIRALVSNRKCVVNQGKANAQAGHMLLPPNIQNIQQLGLQIGNHQSNTTNMSANSSLNLNCNSNGSSLCSLSMNTPRNMDESSNQSHGIKEEQA